MRENIQNVLGIQLSPTAQLTRADPHVLPSRDEDVVEAKLATPAPLSRRARRRAWTMDYGYGIVSSGRIGIRVRENTSVIFAPVPRDRRRPTFCP